jgi:hypothetical protein
VVYVGVSVTRRCDDAMHVKVRVRRCGERRKEGGRSDAKRVKVEVKEKEQIKEENKRGRRGEVGSRPPGEKGGVVG